MRMTLALLGAALLTAAAAPPSHAPTSIFVGTANAATKSYGPADMVCDLNKCRLFSLPPDAGLQPNTIVEFGIPDMGGQDRVEMRRCMETMCRATVLGYPSERTSSPGHAGPTVFITPVELRLQ
jgi:hypothetical protein